MNDRSSPRSVRRIVVETDDEDEDNGNDLVNKAAECETSPITQRYAPVQTRHSNRSKLLGKVKEAENARALEELRLLEKNGLSALLADDDENESNQGNYNPDTHAGEILRAPRRNSNLHKLAFYRDEISDGEHNGDDDDMGDFIVGSDEEREEEIKRASKKSAEKKKKRKRREIERIKLSRKGGSDNDGGTLSNFTRNSFLIALQPFARK